MKHTLVEMLPPITHGVMLKCTNLRKKSLYILIFRPMGVYLAAPHSRSEKKLGGWVYTKIPYLNKNIKAKTCSFWLNKKKVPVLTFNNPFRSRQLRIAIRHSSHEPGGGCVQARGMGSEWEQGGATVPSVHSLNQHSLAKVILKNT